jgi:arylsulfatase A-like enzyme
MPFLARGPGIPAGTVCDHIVQNVDFAPTWLEIAGVPIPRHYQGDSFLASLRGTAPAQSPDQVAYHRYWMHKDGNNNAYVCASFPVSGPNSTRLLKKILTK